MPGYLRYVTSFRHWFIGCGTLLVLGVVICTAWTIYLLVWPFTTPGRAGDFIQAG